MEIIFDKEAINNAVDAILDHKNHDVIRIDGTMDLNLLMLDMNLRTYK